MSIDVMSSVWKHSQHRGTALLLLLALADSANDYGECYPGIAYLAKKCRMKERNLQVLLKELEKSGELVIKRQEGQDTPTGKTNLYTVITPGALVKQGVQRNAPLSQRGAKSRSEGVQNPAQGVQNPVARGAEDCTLPVLPVLPQSGGVARTNGNAAAAEDTRLSAEQRRYVAMLLERGFDAPGQAETAVAKQPWSLELFDRIDVLIAQLKAKDKNPVAIIWPYLKAGRLPNDIPAAAAKVTAESREEAIRRHVEEAKNAVNLATFH